MNGVTISRSYQDINQYGGLVLIDEYIKRLACDLTDCFSDIGTRTSRYIPNISIITAAISLICLGKTNYEDIRALNSESLFTRITGNIISPETYRQRFKELSTDNQFGNFVHRSIVTLLKNAPFHYVFFQGQGYIPLDIDVTPFIDTQSHKEGIGCTYKLKNGFAPIMCYLGQYAISFDLRPGTQHSADGAVEFLKKCLVTVEEIGLDPKKILLRVDSGHDDALFLKAAENLGLNYMIKRNLRKKKIEEYVSIAKKHAKPVISQDGCTAKYRYVDLNLKPTNAQDSDACTVFEVRDPIKDKELGIDLYAETRVTDKNDPLYGRDDVPYTLEAWYTNLKPQEGKDALATEAAFIKEFVGLYEDHAESLQYHSELKTDMNMELLPSHAFAINSAFLALSAVSFNINRLIGDAALRFDKSLQHHEYHKTERIRQSTVISLFLSVPCIVIRHARRLVLKLGKHAPHFHAFKKLCDAL